MYKSIYGFDEAPFRLSVDERFCFYHSSYEKSLMCAAHALEEGDAFVVIVGLPGTGKTTLCRDIIARFDSNDVLTVNMLASQLEAEELFRKLALELDLPAEKYNQEILLNSIKRYMDDLGQANKRMIIFFDEAQNLSVNSFQDLKLLAGLQEGNRPVLQIVLVGHTGLKEAMLEPGDKFIEQRHVVVCELENMTASQTKHYVLHRLSSVGWKGDPMFSDSVFALLHEVTQGTPLLINHVMNTLLQIAAIEDVHHIDEDDLLLATQQLVEENRLSLADGETFASFKQKHQDAKGILNSSSTSGAESPQQDLSSGDGGRMEDDEELDLQIDDLESSDTDWLGWDECEPQHRSELRARNGPGSSSRLKVPGDILKSKSDSETANGTGCEHQWGGVWWMSNNMHRDVTGSLIVADDLPSIRVEECPDLISTVNPVWIDERRNSLSTYGLRLSLIVVLSAFSIGLVIMLILRYMI